MSEAASIADPALQDGTQAPRRRKVGPVLAVLSSFQLATVIFFFLLLLTLFGTLAQVEIGIQDVIEIYFTSWYVLQEIPIKFGGEEVFNLVIPLPGGAPLSILLFFNILIGGLLRLRANWRKVGVIISHFSVLVLLAGGFIAHQFSILGSMVVDEGGRTNVFRDFHLWDIEVVRWTGKDAGEKAFILPEEQVRPLKDDRSRTFFSQDIPFEIKVSNYNRNSRVVGTGMDNGRHLQLLGQRDAKEAERNVPGAEVEVINKDGITIAEGILWGAGEFPLTFEAGGETYGISYNRRTYTTTFTVVLDDFVKENYPGVARAKSYRSSVRKLKEGIEEPAVIKMNHPLRDDGYAIFQADYGPKDVPVGEETYSVFQVAKNPTDHLPLVVCVVIGIGLLIHYCIILFRFLDRSSAKKTGAPTAA
ncbi:MAG: cytochrome c biogenesis protein ResB [Verrucomicrobiota bacterium]